jgi:hypothetical protein
LDEYYTSNGLSLFSLKIVFSLPILLDNRPFMACMEMKYKQYWDWSGLA